MIQITDTLPVSQKDIQTALQGMWGVEEVSDALTDIALGNLRVRLITGSNTVEPLPYNKGASVAYAQSLLLGVYEDGTSVMIIIDIPTTLTKTLKMGILIARQT